MAKQFQLRRGTTSEHDDFTGAVAEITMDTDKNTVVLHDGSTAGGFPLVSPDETTAITDRLTATENATTTNENDIDTLETDLSNLNSTVSDNITDITTVTGDLDLLESQIKITAAKELAAMDIIDMDYDGSTGDLIKITYAGTDNFEDLTYNDDGLSSIDHTVGNVLEGTTTLTYDSGILVSSEYAVA